MQVAVQNLESLGGKKGFILFDQIWIFLFIFIRALETILILFPITSEKGKYCVFFSIDYFSLKFFTELGNNRYMMRLHFSSPRLIQRYMEFRDASRDNAKGLCVNFLVFAQLDKHLGKGFHLCDEVVVNFLNAHEDILGRSDL